MPAFPTLLKELTEIHAVSGYEDDMIRFLSQKMVGMADDIQLDGMGSVIAVKNGQHENSPRVMIFAHMDEVGFMVRKREPSGMIRLLSMAGNSKALPGQEV